MSRLRVFWATQACTIPLATYWRRQANVPPSQVILMVTRRRWSKASSITRCSMSRATLEATGCCQATTRSVSLASAMATINKMTVQNVPSLLAVLMAIATWQYYTERIAWWRRFMAFIKATKLSHRASTRSDITNRTRQRRLILTFHRKKGLQLTCWPLIKIGVWHIKLTRTT